MTSGWWAGYGRDGYRADVCKYCTFDATAAKQLLQEAGGFSGQLNINYNTTSATGQIFDEAIGNMLRQNLGLDVKYTGAQALYSTFH